MSKPTDSTSSEHKPDVPSMPDTPVQAKHLTLSQQLFIWSMILVVGVLFGVGSSWSFIQHSNTRNIDGVSENDLVPRMRVGQKLREILQDAQYDFGNGYAYGTEQTWAAVLQQARYAANLGLQPAGKDLDEVVEEFLNRKTTNGRSYRELLSEHHGGKHSIERKDLERYLAERRAMEALHSRFVVVPAVPRAAGDELAAMWTSRLECDVVELDSTHLLPQVAADDPEVLATYDKIKNPRFARPATVALALAMPDLDALTAEHPVADGDVAARYEQQKETRFKIPGSSTVADYKPLADVASELKTEIAREAARKKAQDLVAAFDASIEELGLEHADSAAFQAAAKHAKLISRSITVAQNQGGTLDLGDLGQVKDPAGVFGKDKEPGFITSRLQAENTDKTWFVARIEAKTEAGAFKPLADVLPEVQLEVAGQRTRKILVEQAEAIRTELKDRGPGSLAAWAASEAAKPWNASVKPETINLLAPFTAPTADLAIPGDKFIAASLSLPQRPVGLAETGATQGAPRVKLIQVREVKSDPISADMGTMLISRYRSGLEQFRTQAFQTELKRDLGR